MQRFSGKLLDGKQAIADQVSGQYGPGIGKGSGYMGSFGLPTTTALQVSATSRILRLNIRNGPSLNINIKTSESGGQPDMSIVEFESTVKPAS